MNHDTLATFGVVVAAVALGFVFGVEATGRLATAWIRAELTVPGAAASAEWIQRAQLARNVAAGVFALGAVGATAAWVRGEDA